MPGWTKPVPGRAPFIGVVKLFWEMIFDRTWWRRRRPGAIARAEDPGRGGVRICPHEEFKNGVTRARLVVRTGEFTLMPMCSCAAAFLLTPMTMQRTLSSSRLPVLAILVGSWPCWYIAEPRFVEINNLINIPCLPGGKSLALGMTVVILTGGIDLWWAAWWRCPPWREQGARAG